MSTTTWNGAEITTEEEAAADRGALFLDQHPAVQNDWRDHLNVEWLAMGDPALCVLGQLGSKGAIHWVRSYRGAVTALELDEDDGEELYRLGFEVNPDGNIRSYRGLTQAWRRMLGGAEYR